MTKYVCYNPKCDWCGTINEVSMTTHSYGTCPECGASIINVSSLREELKIYQNLALKVLTLFD
jgi:predicted RNA-binding Zn-ribbon protein involved in translation (DUF1610 family)